VILLVKETDDFALHACIHNSIIAPLAMNYLSEETSLNVDTRVLATTIQIRHLRICDYFFLLSHIVQIMRSAQKLGWEEHR